jgi:hypothetical protein
MDPVPIFLATGSVGWLWVGVFCSLFFLCGGTIAWVLGYQSGRMDGRADAGKERSDDDQSQVLG